MTDTDTKTANYGLDNARALRAAVEKLTRHVEQEGKERARLKRSLERFEKRLKALAADFADLLDHIVPDAPETPQTEPARKRRAVSASADITDRVATVFRAFEGPMTPSQVCGKASSLGGLIKTVAAACRQLVQEGVLLEAGRKGYALNTIFPPSLKQENGEASHSEMLASAKVIVRREESSTTREAQND